ncbi:MAG: hypothetical protein ACHQFW_06555 [Chitinophagales bacterium]
MRSLIVFLLLFSLNNLLGQNCAPNFTGSIPIADLGENEFNGFKGGKYPGGSNGIPGQHFQKGNELGKSVSPLNINGEIDTINGKTGFMILGYSTAAMTGRFFKQICETHPLNKKMEIIIGAQGGKDINSMVDINSNYYITIDTILADQKLSAAQVQIIWLSTGDILTHTLSFPEQCHAQIEKYQKVLLNLQQLYPNLKLIYLSDRPYAGYIGNVGEGPQELKEPTGYYSSWTIKWLIEKQIHLEKGFSYTEIPFIDWGPLLWTDGSNGNKQGYTWDCTDAGKGGIHASSKGRMKEAAMCWWFYKRNNYLK